MASSAVLPDSIVALHRQQTGDHGDAENLVLHESGPGAAGPHHVCALVEAEAALQRQLWWRLSLATSSASARIRNCTRTERGATASGNSST